MRRSLLIIWGIAAAGLGWTVISSITFLLIKHKAGYREVHFSHVFLLPIKLDEYRKAKGEFWIKEGMSAVSERRLREAFELLQRGLANKPDDQSARVTLAKIYLAAGRPDQVTPLLIDGINYNSEHTGYLRDVISFLFLQQADETIVKLCDQLLDLPKTNNEAKTLVKRARAVASYNLNRFKETVSFIESEGMDRTPQGQLLLARISWEQDNPRAALSRLQAIIDQVPPSQSAEAYTTLVQYLRELGRYGDIRRLSLARRIQIPNNEQAYLDFHQACVDEGDWDAAVSAEKEFFSLFSQNAAALVKLSEYAARIGRPSLAKAVLDACHTLNTEVHTAFINLVLAYFHSGDYAEAMSTLKKEVTITGWNEAQKTRLQAINVLVLSRSINASDFELNLDSLLESKSITANVATAVAGDLNSPQHDVAIDKLLTKALELDPTYLPALTKRLQMGLSKKDISRQLLLIDQFMRVRKPPRDILEMLKTELDSDRYLFVGERLSRVSELSTMLRRK